MFESLRRGSLILVSAAGSKNSNVASDTFGRTHRTTQTV